MRPPCRARPVESFEESIVRLTRAIEEVRRRGPLTPPALTDHGNGTATLTVDGSAAGEYLVELSASDAHGEEWDVYLVRVAPAAETP